MTMAEVRRPATPYRQLSVARARVRSDYDVIVIGAGIGGLTCAAHLAHAGARVLVVERHSLPGGLCSFFKRKGFSFDSGAHFFGSIGDPRTFGGLMLRPLNLDVEFIRLDPVDALHFPDHDLALPGDLDAHIALLQATFPDERAGIQTFLREMLRLYRHFYRGRHDSETLAHYRHRSYQQALDEHLRGDRLKAVLAGTVGYIGLRPACVSAIGMAAMMMSYFSDGGFFARGGSQALADAFLRRIAASGGDVLLNTSVDRILVSRDRATGVVLGTGAEVRARTVISNADARHTCLRLVGDGHLASTYLDRLRTLRPSTSCFVLYLGVSCPDEMLAGKRGWYWSSYRLNDPTSTPLYVETPTLHDRSLCPPGQHIVIVTTVYSDPATDDEAAWQLYKESAAQATLDRVESIIPGLADHVIVKESATRKTIHRYTLNSDGAMYGWDASPDQYWLDRLPVTTPIENLFLCGHWTSSGPGVLAVIASGFLVARAVLEWSGRAGSSPERPLDGVN